MSLNKRERSLLNSRSEAQKIYNQRKEIRRLQQENQQLKINNEKSTYQNLKLLVLLKLKNKTFDIQERKNKELKEVIEKAINDVNLVIELIKLQPTKNDNWILNRLNGLKIILEDKEVK